MRKCCRILGKTFQKVAGYQIMSKNTKNIAGGKKSPKMFQNI